MLPWDLNHLSMWKTALLFNLEIDSVINSSIIYLTYTILLE